MQHGFVSVAAASPAIRVADCENNARRIIAMRKTAIENGASVLLLPSLCITGETCGDLFYQYSLLDTAVDALIAVCENSADDDLFTVVGLPLPLDGKLFKCAAAVHRGNLVGLVPSPFGDNKYFAPARDFPKTALTIEGRTAPFGTGLLFCCDSVPSLNIAIAFQENETHALAASGATLILYPDSAPCKAGDYVKRRSLWLAQSDMHHTAALHAGAGLGESAAGGLYSGWGLVIENGELLAEAPRFSAAAAVSEIDIERIESDRRRDPNFYIAPRDELRVPFTLTKRETKLTRGFASLPFVPEYASGWAELCEETFLLAAHTLASNVRASGKKRIIIELSGEADSTLAALTCANACQIMERPVSDVVGVFMPGYTTGARAGISAMKLGNLLGFDFREIDIRVPVTNRMELVGHEQRGDAAFQNAQVRERAQILQNLADVENGCVIGSSLLSDIALGKTVSACCPDFCVNADVPVTLARAMLQYAAELAAEPLREVLIDVVEDPAADGDAWGAYELLDFFIHHTTRWGLPPDKLLRVSERAFGDRFAPDALKTALENFYNRFFA